MRIVVRKGQRTWYGATRDQIMARARRLDERAREHAAVGDPAELVHRDRDMAAWLRANAERMAS